jgi:long-chain fatty acid transport protein
VTNPLLQNLITAPLFAEDGDGFGWKDDLIFKFGIMYSGFPGWDLVAGYSLGQNPIPDTEVLFNILAPAVMENQITFGITRIISKNQDLPLSFMYGIENSIHGSNPLEAQGQKTIEIGMKLWQIVVGYAFSSL